MESLHTYTIEEKIVASVWVHERPYTGKLLKDIAEQFVERFKKPTPSKAELLLWERNVFNRGWDQLKNTTSSKETKTDGKPVDVLSNLKFHLESEATDICSNTTIEEVKTLPTETVITESNSNEGEFAGTEEYEDHIDEHSETSVQLFKPFKRYHCPICIKTFLRSRDLEKHKRIVHDGVRPYKCGICEKSFSQPAYLKLHARSHGTVKSVHHCTECNYRCSRIGNLKRHISTHNKADKTTYKCVLCEKTFLQRSDLTEHTNTHTKPHQCPLCNQGFARSNTMKRHMDTHIEINNRKYHMCDICFKSFTTVSALRLHRKKYTGGLCAEERHFECAICKKSFSRAVNLSAHQKSCRIVKPVFRCAECNQSFSRLGNMKRHMVTSCHAKHVEKSNK